MLDYFKICKIDDGRDYKENGEDNCQELCCHIALKKMSGSSPSTGRVFPRRPAGSPSPPALLE